MFFALDDNNIRVNAEDGEFKHCVCPACGSPVIQRRLWGFRAKTTKEVRSIIPYLTIPSIRIKRLHPFC